MESRRLRTRLAAPLTALGNWWRARRRWQRRLAILFLVVGLPYLLHGWWLPWVAEFLDVSEEPTPVDYVLILNGDIETRPFVAAALVKGHLARQALVTTAAPTPETDDGLLPPEHEITRCVLRARGVPDSQIALLPGSIASTFDEANVLAKFVDEHPGCSVAIVTNAFHTRRARWVFRRALGDRPCQVYWVAAPREGVRAETWWRTEAGLTTYLSEYVKFVVYWVRY